MIMARWPNRLTRRLENAEAFAVNVRANAANQAAAGIELLSIRVVEVRATA